ncbi:hypothetical protein EAG18_12380 [Pseudoalteromonas sp. J010]|uniref:hypothetical protein n=1 Tax=Pseudoalteromonas sp. J010 TaxID=998465 RepID=UPI000F647ABE|nr:hypothetical protein [Pseudoalteromonas sp. J010]RRS08258.1 hypothetical protein EAG18_12380 [Pseudoalteromonas sp. J010]
MRKIVPLYLLVMSGHSWANDDQVCLYRDPGFNNLMGCYGVGAYNDMNEKNEVSSIKVGKNVAMSGFERSHQRDDYFTSFVSIKELGEYDDDMDSFVVFNKPSQHFACLWQHPNQRGTAFCAAEGQSVSNLNRFKNETSSVSIHGDVKIIGYERANFSSSTMTMMLPVAEMSSFNDDIDSFKVIKRSSNNFACIWQHPNYRGSAQCAEAGESVSNLTNMINSNSSLRLSGEVTFTGYSHSNFSGESFTSYEDIAEFGEFDDDVDSFKVAHRPSNNYICLWEHPEYRGTAFCAAEGEQVSNMHRFKNGTSAISMHGSGIGLKGFSYDDFRGVTFETDYPISKMSHFNDEIDSFQIVSGVFGIDKKRWMSEIYQHIKDKKLSQIVIPGTHDSGSYDIEQGNPLVKKEDIFTKAYELGFEEIVFNWDKTQTDDFKAQLEAGFRYLDLRVAGLPQADGKLKYVWFHSAAGSNDLTTSLQQIADFASNNPDEIVLLEMSRFHKPGTGSNKVDGMTEVEKQAFFNKVVSVMGDRMVTKSSLANNFNPTVSQLLSTGKNIMVMISGNTSNNPHDDKFWTNGFRYKFKGETNPEGLFNERLGKLQEYLQDPQDTMSYMSAAVTPDTANIIGGLLRDPGSVGMITGMCSAGAFATGPLAPLAAAVCGLAAPAMPTFAASMSFEGTASNLIEMAKKANREGMDSRNNDLYTSLPSVHHQGINDMLRWYVTRGYPLNVFGVDDFTSSTGVETAIKANMGGLKRRVGVFFQGDGKDGYLSYTDAYTTTGGIDGKFCTSHQLRYSVRSGGIILVNDTRIGDGKYVEFERGQFPPDAEVRIQASSPGAGWHNVSKRDGTVWRNIESMIDNRQDVYVRGADQGFGYGKAWASDDYRAHVNCFGNIVGSPSDSEDNLGYAGW